MTSATLLLFSSLAAAGTPQGVVLEFSSKHCGPCQEMAPAVERLIRKGYAIKQIDCDRRPELVQKFRIKLMPTFVLIVRGEEVRRIVGTISEAQLQRLAMQVPVEDEQPPEEPAESATMPADPPELPPLAASPKKRGFSLPFLGGSDEPEQPEEPAVARGNIDDADAITRQKDFAPGLAICPRIRIQDGTGVNFGSGVIVESRVGRTLILTCGHVFRDMTKDSTIDVDIFAGQRHATFLGKVIKYDLKSDVGLISIPTAEPLPTASIATAQHAPKVSDLVYSIGCSSGDSPTRLQHRVTALNRYVGPDNVECTTAPIQGRSGGGLFNRQGEVIGICFAADERDNRGIYAGLGAIHKLLDELKLAYLYKSEEPGSSPSAELASRTNEAVRDPASQPQPPVAVPVPRVPEDFEPVPANDTASSELTDAIANAGNAEVVCIIRPLDGKSGPSRVVIIHRASAKFLKDLRGEVEPGPMPTMARFERAAAEPIHAAPFQFSDRLADEDSRNRLSAFGDRTPRDRAPVGWQIREARRVPMPESTLSGHRAYRRNR
jgi:S1-C subfamily serine protease